MMTVAIVGCGKIADDHIALIRSRPDCEIVAVCDREELMAGQLAERHQIRGVFSDVQTLLEETRPQVVHVTTPPQSHCDIARMCLVAGAHVLVEKPFTVNAAEAVELTSLADRLNLKITVHHDQQFTYPARRMHELIDKGYLGGRPVHVESYYGYDLGQASYAKALLGDKDHWVRQLPGGLLHNVISHGIAKIVEFLPTDSPTVIAHGFASEFVRAIGESGIVDELRVIVSDNTGFTAYFTFSSQFRPALHLFRVYGKTNGLEVDHDQQTLVRLPGARYKIFLEKIVPSWNLARQHMANFGGNIARFMRRDLHPRGGSLHLVHRFYDSILSGAPPPVSARDMVMTVAVMDEIFLQLSTARTARRVPASVV
jgi:predicted dehydrogenase